MLPFLVQWPLFKGGWAVPRHQMDLDLDHVFSRFRRNLVGAQAIGLWRANMNAVGSLGDTLEDFLS